MRNLNTLILILAYLLSRASEFTIWTHSTLKQYEVIFDLIRYGSAIGSAIKFVFWIYSQFGG
jgi:hypothetical protein